MEKREINIIDYFLLFYRARKFIIWNFIIVVFLAAVASMLMPKYYKTSALILPPEEGSKGFGFADVLSKIQTTRLTIGTRGSPVDLSIGVMKSETMAYTLIEKFNLVKVYGVSNRDQARSVLKRLSKISLSKEGLIQVEVQDRDPQLAADLANTYCTVLDSIKQALNQRKSRERADFIEQQILENSQNLTTAELELKNFQLRNNAISPFLQQRVAISVTSDLELDLFKKEIQLKEYRSKSFSDSHPVVSELLNNIKFNEELLQDMRFGSKDNGQESLFVPLQEGPELTLEYSRLSRRVEILGMLEQLLRQQFEEARIEQVNTTSQITILDRAYPPVVKCRPKRKLIVLVAGFASMFLSVVSILAIDYFNRLTALSEANRRKVRQLAGFLKIEK